MRRRNTPRLQSSESIQTRRRWLRRRRDYVSSLGSSLSRVDMLGFRFCPRLRDFPDRKLAAFEAVVRLWRDSARSSGVASRRMPHGDVIREHWEEVLRLVASLKAGTVLLSAMLNCLAAFQRQNQFDLALQELGRIERSLFMLDWLELPQLRQHCNAGLNKSEQRHALTQVICTFKQGVSPTEGMTRSSSVPRGSTGDRSNRLFTGTQRISPTPSRICVLGGSRCRTAWGGQVTNEG